LPERSGTGRPRRYCRPGCRQQAHLARKFAAAHGLGDDDVIVDRQKLEELQDALYCLQASIEDVDGDLRGRPTAAEVRTALDWLLSNARPLVGVRIEPKADAAS
jgi:hypothetical protein